MLATIWAMSGWATTISPAAAMRRKAADLSLGTVIVRLGAISPIRLDETKDWARAGTAGAQASAAAHRMAMRRMVSSRGVRWGR